MKVSDYIVEFFADKGVTDVFGYPGGMVTHLMESFSANEEQIRAHVNYHEQAAAFAACGYAQAKGETGVAYATSGPGATNLITGIANAWFDSIPVIFITGQVNTFEAKGKLAIRQNGFQETDILSMVRNITKYCVYVEKEQDIRYELEKAWHIAGEGRKGPVLLDVPMNIQRSDVNPQELTRFTSPEVETANLERDVERFQKSLKEAERPVLLVGSGVKTAKAKERVLEFIEKWNIPVVSSMLAFDVTGRNHSNYFGFIGAYGDRTANFIIAKSDLIISLGSRLDIRQVGSRTENFGKDAKLIRIDIDEGELSRKIKENEWDIQCDLDTFLKKEKEREESSYNSMEKWLSVCRAIRQRLTGMDDREPNEWIRMFSERLPEGIDIMTDVGQNQVWIAQSFRSKKGQEVFFSGGHGAMGYSLPAAIGAYYGNGKPVVSFNGDGGIQMNIQELQFVVREKLPILIVILNNSSLGMIRHFQEMYFESNYYQTMGSGGYTVPDFEKIAGAYGIEYYCIDKDEKIEKWDWNMEGPKMIEIRLEDVTYVFPKLEYGRPNQDQEPLLERKLYDELMELGMESRDWISGGYKTQGYLNGIGWYFYLFVCKYYQISERSRRFGNE